MALDDSTIAAARATPWEATRGAGAACGGLNVWFAFRPTVASANDRHGPDVLSTVWNVQPEQFPHKASFDLTLDGLAAIFRPLARLSD